MKFKKSLIRMIAIAEKEWLQIRRDMRSLYLLVFSPALFTILFGYALTVDVKNVSMAIYDQDRSSTSRKFIEEFSHTEYLKIYSYVTSYKEIDRLIDIGDIKLGLVIPRNFEKHFKSGKKTDIQVLADGSDATSSMVSVGYVKVIVANYNINIKVNELKRIGISESKLPVDVQSRIWYNPELQSKNFIIPGVIVITLAIISALTASLTISREWERGTMETLITTPLHGFELVAGKLFPYLLIGVLDVVIMLSMGYFIFNVQIKGSFVELCFLTLLFLIGTNSLGMMISSATRVQVLSVQIAMIVTYLPAMILSGFIFPIHNMPLVIQGITYLVPAKYLIVIIKGIVLKGVAASLMWAQIIFLFVFASIVILISIKKITLRLPEK